jgi:WD40 repeat protein
VFAPDGGRILTAFDDKTARIWDRDGKLLATLVGHTEPVISAVFAPDGRSIVTAAKEACIGPCDAFHTKSPCRGT